MVVGLQDKVNEELKNELVSSIGEFHAAVIGAFEAKENNKGKTEGEVLSTNDFNNIHEKAESVTSQIKYMIDEQVELVDRMYNAGLYGPAFSLFMQNSFQEYASLYRDGDYRSHNLR